MTQTKTEQILIYIEGLKKDIEYIKTRLDKINGSLEDYSVYKERANVAYNSLEEINKTINGIKVKVWSIAGVIGSFSALIGIIIGKFIG